MMKDFKVELDREGCETDDGPISDVDCAECLSESILRLPCPVRYNSAGNILTINTEYPNENLSEVPNAFGIVKEKCLDGAYCEECINTIFTLDTSCVISVKVI